MTRPSPVALIALAGVIALVAVLSARSQPQPARPGRIWELTTKLASLGDDPNPSAIRARRALPPVAPTHEARP